MENNPKPKQMQQGNPNAMFCLAWFSLPKWMKNNQKKPRFAITFATKMQQSNPSDFYDTCTFCFF